MNFSKNVCSYVYLWAYVCLIFSPFQYVNSWVGVYLFIMRICWKLALLPKSILYSSIVVQFRQQQRLETYNLSVSLNRFDRSSPKKWRIRTTDNRTTTSMNIHENPSLDSGGIKKKRKKEKKKRLCERNKKKKNRILKNAFTTKSQCDLDKYKSKYYITKVN